MSSNIDSDLGLVSKALSFVHSGSLDFLFGSKNIFDDVAVVTYDDKNIYLFNPRDTSYKVIAHEITYDWEKQQGGWSTSLRIKEFLELLPEEVQSFWFISGGLFSHLSEIQEQKKSIYTTEDSYIATVIHELGHIFFNKSNPHYYTDKNETLNYMETAMKLYEGKALESDYKIHIPAYSGLSEVFAFCTEYTFAEKFALSHKERIDKVFRNKIERTIPHEKELNFLFQDSNLASSHFYSYVIGKILMEKYPSTWCQELISLKITI